MLKPFGCDECLGVERDEEGFAWLPGENEHDLQDVATGAVVTVTRKEAFHFA